MTEIERCVSSTYVQKLGHSLQEIRERALKNIVSKFEHGFTCDNDLARTKEILQKLFEWFLFEECSHEDVVLRLIKQILRTESGLVLMKHCGFKAIVAELMQVKSCIEAKYHPLVEDILEFVKSTGHSIEKTVVPPLQSDVPLSYRSCESSHPFTIETTATPIEGFVRGDSSLEQQTGACKSTPDKHERQRVSSSFRWQPLVKPDRHVLQSVEDSLRNPPQPSGLLHSCEFFTDIMIHDFPPEIFLQRPGIVTMFQKLILTTPSTRVAACVMKCVLKLTQLLKARLNYYSDPGTHNLKHGVHSNLSSPESRTYSTDGTSESDSDFLQARQISLPYYCLSTMKCVFAYLHVKPGRLTENTAKKKHPVNVALSLLTDLIKLLAASLEEPQKITSTEFADVFADVLVKFGDVIENLRLEVLSNDYESFRIVHLHLLCSCAHLLGRFVPPEQSSVLLPRNLKNALGFAVLDLSFSQLYPGVHGKLLAFVQEFDGHCKGDSISKYDIIKDVCASMTSSVRLLKKDKSLSVLDCVVLMRESLPSLEFHRNLSLLKIFVDLCANRLPMHSFKDDVLKTVEEITLCLLAHNDPEIRLEMYRLCHKKIIAAIGPKLNTSGIGAPGSQILFLIRSQVLVEMALHGMNAAELQTYAEDMLVHVLKCKILVSDEIWNGIVEALIPALPVFLSHADAKSVLGRTLVSMLDPDRAASLNFGALEILRGNALLLFNNDPSLREEGVSRLSWMLASEDGARELLPKLNNLHDRALSAACRIDRVFDLNRVRSPQQFYQPSSLFQVLQLLSSDNVEPVIRRSALTQIAVMMEDPLVHATFVQNGGVQIVTGVMKSALKDTSYSDYPDSVIPCVSILKNACLHNAGVRHELSTNADALYFTVRGLFLFCTEARMKQDGSALLFLLLLNNFVRGTPSRADLAIPKLISEKLCAPFSCKTHSDASGHAPKSLADDIAKDKWSLSSLQIHWNAEWFGGFGELLSWNQVDYGSEGGFDEVLRMSESQLGVIKQSSLEFCIGKHLDDVRNATGHHQNIVDSINKLTECLELYAIVKEDCAIERKLLGLPWRQSFVRFLDAPPSSASDAEFLSCVLRFLDALLLFYKYTDDCWMVSFLKEKANPLLEVLNFDTSHDAETKSLNKELLHLMANCASYEQRYLNFHSDDRRGSSSWSHVVDAIAENLKISDAQHFYNLAYLDCLLSCLVHLTAVSGWSRSKIGSSAKPTLVQLVASLCEMIDAFHSSKGPSAADSLMGLSITRHAVLILNHVLVEMQHFNLKDWDSCFMKEESGLENWVLNLYELCTSRDVVLRAAVYQLFSGLAVSNRCATELVQELKDRGGGFWQNCLSILMQYEEACIVKENVANLLANACSHAVALGNDGCMLDAGVAPTYVGKQGGSPTQSVLKLLDDVNFYKELDSILSCLYPSGTFCFVENNAKRSTDLQTGADAPTENNSLINGEYVYAYINNADHPSSRTHVTDDNNSVAVVTTPSYVKALTSLVFNSLLLAPSEVSFRFQEHDLFKSFFKCLRVPELELRSTKDLALYCDLLEMNAGICSVLTEAAGVHAACLGAILHARDCLNALFALLNPSIYHTTLPQLVYLRNKLWSEIFALIAAVLNHRNAFSVVSSALCECGHEPFLQTLYEAITSKNSIDLQQSALTSLTSLLHGVPSEDKSMHNLLDKTRTPRTPASIEENRGPANKCSSSSEEQKRNLEKRYETEDLMAGATLCKILMHLLEIASVKRDAQHNRKKSLAINTLTSVLCVSHEAKTYALDNGLLETIVQQLKEFHLKLSLDSVEVLRRVSDRKRLSPILKEIGCLLGLLTNFMLGESTVKNAACKFGFADLIHKLWAWLLTQKELLLDALRALCTYTTECLLASQSLPLTSSVAGAGPRKMPSNVSLLHAVINLISKEMDQISRTHDLMVLQLCFHLLENSCNSVECRIVLSKANFLHCLTRLNPVITKKQKPWECVELIWLEFLQAFTSYPEGQACVAKISDALDLVIILTNSARSANRQAAMIVLRNISFYQCNRPRLLTSAEFLNTLEGKLACGSLEEKNLVVTIMWSLAANNQKAKLVFKCAGLDRKLQETLKILHLAPDVDVNRDDLDRMHYVLKLLKDDKCK